MTTAVSSFNSNPEVLSSCPGKPVIATNASTLISGKSVTNSSLNTAVKSLCGVGAVSTCNRYDVATYRSKASFVSDDNFSFPKNIRRFKSERFKWLLWLCYLPCEIAVYYLTYVLFGHTCPEKASRAKHFHSQPFRP